MSEFWFWWSVGVVMTLAAIWYGAVRVRASGIFLGLIYGLSWLIQDLLRWLGTGYSFREYVGGFARTDAVRCAVPIVALIAATIGLVRFIARMPPAEAKAEAAEPDTSPDQPNTEKPDEA